MAFAADPESTRLTAVSPVRTHPCKAHMIIYMIEIADILILRAGHWQGDPDLN
jgi:hypothetical protein